MTKDFPTNEVEQIDALLHLNANGSLTSPVPGLAIELLKKYRAHLSEAAQRHSLYSNRESSITPRNAAQPPLENLVREYARDLRKSSSGEDDLPATADYLETLIERAHTFNDAQGTLDRDLVAKTIYATWFDADFITENHFRWFDAGKDNPDSCVHYSNVAKAYKVADAVLALAAQPPAAPVEHTWDQGEHEGCGIDSQRAYARWSAGSDLAKVADWLDDQARIATNSLHCGDNSAMIQQTHDWADKLETVARLIRNQPQAAPVTDAMINAGAAALFGDGWAKNATPANRRYCREKALAIFSAMSSLLLSRPAPQQAPVTAQGHLQSRGRHYDIIKEAIAAYDEYMLDDDYDAQGTLNQIIKKMRERVELSDAPSSPVSRPHQP